MDEENLSSFMSFISTGQLIHSCIDNFQEQLINQQHNEVTVTEAD